MLPSRIRIVFPGEVRRHCAGIFVSGRYPVQQFLEALSGNSGFMIPERWPGIIDPLGYGPGELLQQVGVLVGVGGDILQAVGTVIHAAYEALVPLDHRGGVGVLGVSDDSSMDVPAIRSIGSFLFRLRTPVGGPLAPPRLGP